MFRRQRFGTFENLAAAVVGAAGDEGADGFILKPFEPAAILDLARRLLP